MSLNRYLKGSEHAIQLIQRFQAEAPVNVVKIAEDLGVRVWEDNLPDGVSGKLIWDQEHGGRSGYSILVNNRDPATRKRFTVAHEVAHYLLHRQMIGSEIEDNALYRSRLTSKIEGEANALAAEILMPRGLLYELLDGDITKNGKDIAKRLQVSESALKARLGMPT